MYKINVFTIGKTKHSWLDVALAEYTKRLKAKATIKWHLVKNSFALEHALSKESSYIALDPCGKTYSSEAFSNHILKSLEKGGSKITFVIGGDIGLTQTIKEKAASLLSLSYLTFTHQITRLVLLEQLYRAFEIERGSPYHK